MSTCAQTAEAAIEANRPSRSQVIDLEVEPLIRKPDGTWGPLHFGQRQSWESIRRIVAVFAGWRSGKTEIGPWWLLREIQRGGDGDYAVIAPTYPLLNGKARPALRKAFIKALGKDGFRQSGDEWYITDAGQMRLWGEVRGETRVLFRHGTRAEAIEAFDAKGIWVDEPGQLQDELWQQIKARVSVGRYRVLLTSRPYEHNWYVDEIWNKVVEVLADGSVVRRPDADENIEVVNFRSIDNPSFTEEEYEEWRASLPDWLFQLKLNGIPTKPVGAIYDCFSKLNLIKRQKIPRDWPLYLGVDFGSINTAAVILAGELDEDGRPTGRFFVIATYKADKKTGRALDHIQAVRKLIAPDIEGRNPSMPIAFGGSHTEDGWRESWNLSGVAVGEPQPNDVTVQIQRVYAAFKTLKLLVFDDLKNLISDVNHYSLELDDEGEPIDGKIKDKAKYHRLDALRYVVTMLVRDSKTWLTKVTKVGGKAGQVGEIEGMIDALMKS